MSSSSSPLHQLVAIWRHCRPPVKLEVAACRARLFTAAVHEITAKANAGICYDPMSDCRFRWANQWLDLAHGDIKSIDPSIEMLCSLTMEPCPRSHQPLAAADQ